jgi:hypothetical protein
VKAHSGRIALNFVFFVFTFICFMLLLGSYDGVIKIFGSSSSTNLLNFQSIFNDLGGPNKSGDGGWHLRVAIELASQDYVNRESLWWLTSAPPGVAIIEGLIIKLVGYQMFGVTYCILICLLWTFSVIAFFDLFNSAKDLFIRCFAIIFLLQYTGFGQWMIGQGVFFTEALSTPFVIISFSFFLRSFKAINETWRSLHLGLASLFLASAAFVRANFLYVAYLFLLLGFLGFVLRKLFPKRIHFELLTESRNYSNYLMYGIGPLLALIPYFFMAYSYLKMPFGALNSSGFHLQYAWINPARDGFKSIGAGWLCEINSKYCQDGFQAVTPVRKILQQDLETLLGFPSEVITSRAGVFGRGWFSGEAPGATGSYDAILQGLIIVFLFILIASLVFNAFDSQVKRESKLFLFLVVSLLVPYSLTHLEVRYLIPAKIFTLLFSIRFAILYLSSKENKLLRIFNRSGKN